MAELPPEMARLIEAARRAHDPTDADSERVRRGLAAAIGAQASLGQSGASDGAASSLSPGSLGSLVGTTGGKLLLVAALLGGAGGLYTWSSGSAPRAALPDASQAVVVTPLDRPSLPPASPVEQSTASVERRAVREEPSAHPRAAEAASAAAVEPLRVPARASAARPARKVRADASLQRAREPAAPSDEARSPGQRAAQPARPSEAASEAAPVLRASVHSAAVREPAAREVPREIVKEESEVALIRAALASLNAGDSQRALDQLEAHATRYPVGAMGRERAGLRVLALCATGRLQEGRREQAAFLEAATDSPLHNRVRRACGLDADVREPNREQSR